jgi:hypothetical protein
LVTVGEPRKCAFIEGRNYNFAADEISMAFCKVCTDAYKSSGGAKGTQQPADKSKETGVTLRLGLLDV